MSPVAHFLGSWLIASATANNSRDRKLITVAGVLPDADGLGMIADIAKSVASGTENTFHFYQQYHHNLLHGWPAAIVVAIALACFARERWRVALLCLLAFHLHLACDLLGSRGPTAADLWPIAYGEPLFRHPIWFWKSQWRLDGWQNKIIFVTLFALSLGFAMKRGFSFVEVFSSRGDSVFVAVLRKWKGQLAARSSRN